MKQFASMVAWLTAVTLYVGGALGVFLISLSLALVLRYCVDWSRL
jgi:hypothetical protein